MGKLTPNGKFNSRIFLISAWQFSVSPEDVSMMPRPPALDTAEASCVRAIQPMGACKIGYLAPVCAKTLFVFVVEWVIHQAQNTLPDFSYQAGT